MPNTALRLLILLVSVPASLAHADDILSAEDAIADITLARAALEQIHPGYERYTPREKLDAYWAELASRAADGIDRGELYLHLSEILAAIRCDHTKAELPSDLEERRKSEPVYLPFSFRLFDGRMYVDRVAKGLDLDRGDEITAIDNRPVGRWITAVEKYIPVDGETDHVKPNEIESSTEFMGPALEHFAPYLYDIYEQASLQVATADGKEEVMLVDRVGYTEYEAIIGQKRYSRNFVDSVRYKALGRDGAYLAVDTFVNYREPVDAMAHLAPYFEKLKRQGRDKLILDLRQNGGGSDDAQTALLRHIITEPLLQAEAKLTRYRSLDPAIKPRLSTWQQEALDPDPEWFEDAGDGFYRIVAAEAGAPAGPVEPAEHAFDGQLVLLTSSSNASGLTHLIANLETAGRATFVGEKTGGAPTGATAGIIFFLELPASGIKVRVPAQRTVIANAGSLPDRDGIEPDVAAPETAESWLEGRDPALEAAKRYLDL
ncbi:MAG: S41 family peptidase [Woeseiaceae bacterium]|nr:S41 family peptidase [Woeseiaceae bacterium]